MPIYSTFCLCAFTMLTHHCFNCKLCSTGPWFSLWSPTGATFWKVVESLETPWQPDLRFDRQTLLVLSLSPESCTFTSCFTLCCHDGVHPFLNYKIKPSPTEAAASWLFGHSKEKSDQYCSCKWSQLFVSDFFLLSRNNILAVAYSSSLL